MDGWVGVGGGGGGRAVGAQGQEEEEEGGRRRLEEWQWVTPWQPREGILPPRQSREQQQSRNARICQTRAFEWKSQRRFVQRSQVRG